MQRALMLPAYALVLRNYCRLTGSMLSVLPKALWPRLSLLIMAATGPLVALLVFLAVADGLRVQDTALIRVEQLAVLAAEQQDEMVQEVASLLHVLAYVPEIRLMNGPECDSLLNAITTDHTKVSGLAVAGVDGVVSCSANPAARGMSVADRSYFQQALAAGSPSEAVVSPLTTSRVTGKPAVFLAVPLLRSPGSDVPAGAIIAALDLGWFSHLSNSAKGLQDQVVLVIDSRDGAVLARAPDEPRRVGQRFPDHPIVKAFKASSKSGSLQTEDFDGVRHVFGFAPLPGRAAGLIIAIGLPEAAVRAEADQRFWLSIAITLSAGCIALLTGWLIAKSSVLRPISALVAAAAQIGAGNLAVKVTMERGAAKELRSLGAAFTRMARRLHARDHRIATMQTEIAISEEHHRLLTENVNDMITRYSPDLRRVYVSPSCRDLLGYAPDEMVGHRLGANVHPDDRAALEKAVNQPLLAGASTARAAFRAIHKDGRAIWLECSGRRIDDGSGFVMVTRDISARKELETQLEDANRQLRILARQDGLTHLANRRRFDEVLGEEYRRAMRVSSSLAVLMLDVDWFKAFNDTYGHPAGDACLQAVATAIQLLARRPADLPARYGGEEFVILLPDTDAAGALALAERIRSAVRDLAVPHAGSELDFVTISVGVAVMVPFVTAQGPAALIEAADAALYQAKHAGRDTVRLANALTVNPTA